MRRTGDPAHPGLAFAWLVLVAAFPISASSHEIPNDVTVSIIVKPDGDTLDVLVRAPLESMQDIIFPTRGPGYLNVGEAEQTLRDAAERWLRHDIELRENGRPLPPLELVAARASIPSDRSFREHSSARAHVLGPPIPETVELVWQQALLDALFTVPIGSEDSAFAIRPALGRLGLAVTAVIRFEAPGNATRIYRLDGATDFVELDPRWHQAALRFVGQGTQHILGGYDHLLFLFCLVLPFRRHLRSLVLIVTAFTVAHSITLIGSAFGLTPPVLWFTPLIETLIAASIFYMAVENVFAPTVRMRWTIAFGFGLIHGFGFSFALRDTLQFAGDHLLASLLAFNVGVELGQLLVLLLVIPALNLAFRLVRREQLAIVVISVVIGHTAWHWMGERWTILRAYPIGLTNPFASIDYQHETEGADRWHA